MCLTHAVSVLIATSVALTRNSWQKHPQTSAQWTTAPFHAFDIANFFTHLAALLSTSVSCGGRTTIVASRTDMCFARGSVPSPCNAVRTARTNPTVRKPLKRHGNTRQAHRTVLGTPCKCQHIEIWSSVTPNPTMNCLMDATFSALFASRHKCMRDSSLSYPTGSSRFHSARLFLVLELLGHFHPTSVSHVRSRRDHGRSHTSGSTERPNLSTRQLPGGAPTTTTLVSLRVALSNMLSSLKSGSTASKLARDSTNEPLYAVALFHIQGYNFFATSSRQFSQA